MHVARALINNKKVHDKYVLKYISFMFLIAQTLALNTCFIFLYASGPMRFSSAKEETKQLTLLCPRNVLCAGAEVCTEGSWERTLDSGLLRRLSGEGACGVQSWC